VFYSRFSKEAVWPDACNFWERAIFPRGGNWPFSQGQTACSPNRTAAEAGRRRSGLVA